MKRKVREMDAVLLLASLVEEGNTFRSMAGPLTRMVAWRDMLGDLCGEYVELYLYQPSSTPADVLSCIPAHVTGLLSRLDQDSWLVEVSGMIDDCQVGDLRFSTINIHVVSTRDHTIIVTALG